MNSSHHDLVVVVTPKTTKGIAMKKVNAHNQQNLTNKLQTKSKSNQGWSGNGFTSF
jgi:hypothetical protein